MKILVIGNTRHFEECRQKFGTHECSQVESHAGVGEMLTGQDLLFDFLIDANPEAFGIYAGKDITAFLNTCRTTLTTLTHGLARPVKCTVFGFNGFPTMFSRELLEASLLRPDDNLRLKKICDALKTEFLVVDDRVGMVSPRVVCMIINEAFFTVQEGTATREDIDLAMRLGTNYPYGPFEWCEKIGLKNVYELLVALYEDTKDGRYKISALMKKEYLGL